MFIPTHGPVPRLDALDRERIAGLGQDGSAMRLASGRRPLCRTDGPSRIAVTELSLLGARRRPFRAGKNSAGSTIVRFKVTPQCRCGPVTRPVAPTSPMTPPL